MSDLELAEVASPSVGNQALTSGAVGILVGVNLLWSASPVAAKSALTVFSPLTVSALRFGPAGLILLAIARAHGPLPKIALRDWPRFFVLALLGIVLTYGLYYTGVANTSASEAVLLTACEPILIALFARIFLKELLSKQQWVGLWIGLAGMWLLVGGGFGNALALFALCIETTTTVTAKRLTALYPGLFVVAVEMLLGSLLLLPGVGWELVHRHPAVTWEAFAGVLYLGLACSALCYGLWFRLMERYPVSLMGAFILIQPLFGPVSGWLFRHETLTVRGLFGGALVILGVAFNALRFPNRVR